MTTTSLLRVISSIMNIKRWNLMPQVETWTEAENIAYYTHMAFAIGREGLKMNYESMEKMLTRCLLKSLNKHILSDISISSRDVMRHHNPQIWDLLINESAKQISDCFPRTLSGKFYEYLTFCGDYTLTDPNTSKETIEDLIKYCQYKSALEECTTNMKVFGTSKYKLVQQNILDKIDRISKDKKDNYDLFETTFNVLSNNGYFETIKQLKNLRRWNNIIRSNESTVMGHTFMVSVLTIIFANIEFNKTRDSEDFIYGSILRALFHDVPESLTGDVITPVKDIINRKDDKCWSNVEDTLVEEFKKNLPERIKDEFKKYTLLEDFGKALFSQDSLVKACDQLALIFECLYEREWGSNIVDMQKAYDSYTSKLQNSEWISIREYANSLLIEFPR